MKNFRKEIRGYFENYYNNNDSAHRIDHADQVCDTSIQIAVSFGLDVSIKEIIIASYAHDMFLVNGRDNHHEEAFNYILNNSGNKFITDLSDVSRYRIAFACLEHRASYEGVFFSELSALISAADRGDPSLVRMMIRSMDYSFDHHQEFTKEEHINHVINHIIEKYGRNGGYMFKNMNPLYMSYYKNSIQNMWDAIDTISYQMGANIYNQTLRSRNTKEK